MKRFWIITVFMIAFIGIGWFLVGTIMNIPKATAPAILENSLISGPLTFYYIAVDDAGQSGAKIGCGDSAVSVKTGDVQTDSVIKSTFTRLLSDKNQYYGESGLYNVLYRSNLSYVSSSVSGDTVTVNLTGDLSLGGECDNPRVQATLEMTAVTAAGVKKAAIFVNSKPLSEVLSLK